MNFLPATLRCLPWSRSMRYLPVTLNSLRHCSKSQKSSQLMASTAEPQHHQLTLAEKVKETSKDITYSGVILVGIGAAGVVLYTLWKEMMSSQGTTAIYNKTSTRLMNDSRVKDMLGTPIVAHGELSSRGRRRHISRSTYEKDGAKYLRMVYYLKGSHGKATVQLEMKQNESRKYDLRYLFVEKNGFPREVLLIEDNRAALDTPALPETSFFNQD